jgi:signal transduction histidine kinase
MKKRILIVSLLFLVNNMFAQSKLVTKWNPYTQSYETTYEEDYYEKRERERKEEERKSRQSLEESDRRFNETLNKYVEYQIQQKQQQQQIAINNSRYLSNIANQLNNSINYLKLNCLFTEELQKKYDEYLNSKKNVNYLDFYEVENTANRLNFYLSYFSNYPCKK